MLNYDIIFTGLNSEYFSPTKHMDIKPAAKTMYEVWKQWLNDQQSKAIIHHPNRKRIEVSYE